MDLAIFTKNDVNEINHHHLTKGNYGGYLTPRFAFELGINIKDTEKHITNDIEKLKKCTEAGYIIHIYRDNTVARTGTKRRTEKDIVITTKFRKVIEKTSKTIDKNIKLIAIIINPQRKNEEDWVKCEIFDRRKHGNWIPFRTINSENQKEIEEILNAQLN